jgi:hypothetical protein
MNDGVGLFISRLSASSDRLTDKWWVRRDVKEAIVAYSRYWKIAYVPAEVRTEHISSTSLELYRETKPFLVNEGGKKEKEWQGETEDERKTGRKKL